MNGTSQGAVARCVLVVRLLRCRERGGDLRLLMRDVVLAEVQVLDRVAQDAEGEHRVHERREAAGGKGKRPSRVRQKGGARVRRRARARASRARGSHVGVYAFAYNLIFVLLPRFSFVFCEFLVGSICRLILTFEFDFCLLLRYRNL